MLFRSKDVEGIVAGDITLAAGSRIVALNTTGNGLTISADIGLGTNGLSFLAGTTGTFLGGDIAVSGNITGTGGITKTNATGTLTLSGTNGYGGSTSIAGGMVSLDSASGLGNGPLTFTAGNGVTAVAASARSHRR